MEQKTLRSIEGVGVPLLIVGGFAASILWGTWTFSSYFNELKTDTLTYRSQNDNKVLGLEKGLSDLTLLVKDLAQSIKANRELSHGGFDIATCEELVMAIKIANPTLTVPSCFDLPSAKRFYPSYPHWARRKR